MIEILILLIVTIMVIAMQMRFEDVSWEEEIDLNAGPAAIATSLTEFSGYRRVGTDQWQAPREKGLRIISIRTQDESPQVAPAFGDLALASRRGGDISLPIGSTDKPGLLDLRPGIKLPSGEIMDVLGNGSGAATEMHSVVIRVMNPNHEMPFTFAAPPEDAEIAIYEMPTDANTAVSLDNFVDVAGRDNAYTNGQTEIPDDEKFSMYVKAITASVPAGQGGFVIAPPGTESVLIYPAPALSTFRVDFTKEFGNPFFMTADNPIRVGSYGNATTLVPLVLEMAIVRPAGE